MVRERDCGIAVVVGILPTTQLLDRIQFSNMVCLRLNLITSGRKDVARDKRRACDALAVAKIYHNAFVVEQGKISVQAVNQNSFLVKDSY